MEEKASKEIAKVLRTAIGNLNHTHIGYANDHDYMADPYVDDIMKIIASYYKEKE